MFDDEVGPAHLSVRLSEQEYAKVCQNLRGPKVLVSESRVETPLRIGPRHVHDIISKLIEREEVNVNAVLQSVLDRRTAPQLNLLFESLWEARFDYREGASLSELIPDMICVGDDSESPVRRFDRFFFWCSLAARNRVLSRVICSFSPVGAALDARARDELLEFISTAERWAGLGSPARVLLRVEQGILDEETPLSNKLRQSLV